MSQQKDPSREPSPPLKSSSDSGLLACKMAFLVASSTWLVHLSAFTTDGDHQEHVKAASGYRMSTVGTWGIKEGSKVSPSQMCGFSTVVLISTWSPKEIMPHTYRAKVTKWHCWHIAFYQPRAICHIIPQATDLSAQPGKFG